MNFNIYSFTAALFFLVVRLECLAVFKSFTLKTGIKSVRHIFSLDSPIAMEMQMYSKKTPLHQVKIRSYVTEWK